MEDYHVSYNPIPKYIHQEWPESDCLDDKVPEMRVQGCETLILAIHTKMDAYSSTTIPAAAA